jgi:2-keto-4-pentenoate hydratase/2-oxohepta-3-ene-1,7-dioic acid hydratase in catechol pathway
MRLGTLKTGELVVLAQGRATPVQGFGSMLELIHDRPALQAARGGEPVRPDDLAAPLANPSKIIAVGLNYVDHAAETKLELPKTPLVFAKFPSAITGPTDPIRIPRDLTQQVDFEAELGVVVGREAKNVSRANALGHVFGYTVLNDISARDLQFADQQWVRGKSLDSFCPMGPCIVTGDEVGDPQALTLTCSVNGQEYQRATTRDMIFSVADLIEQLSYAFTLYPGDLIASGTPSGVGFTRTPPVYLQPGDTLRTAVSGIGELVNPVVAA